MNADFTTALVKSETALSAMARRKMLAMPGEPFFISRWKRAAFIHFEIDPQVLQRAVPFEIDLRDGKAYVSLVAFHLEKMRLRCAERISEWLMKPIGTHEFLNVRTYVRHRGETGIYFLAEFLPNRLSVQLGPRLYGLPYRLAHLDYRHFPESGKIEGQGSDGKNRFSYEGVLPRQFKLNQCEGGSLDEFLVERYTAFTHQHGVNRCFRVWHPPWSVTPIEIKLNIDELFATTGDWCKHAEWIGAHYSPGFESVWMGRPRRISKGL